MGIKSCLRGIATVAIVISWFSAMAVEVTEDTTVSLTANSDTSYEIADGVTLTIEVVGMTNTLSGCITGIWLVVKNLVVFGLGNGRERLKC